MANDDSGNVSMGSMGCRTHPFSKNFNENSIFWHSKAIHSFQRVWNTLISNTNGAPVYPVTVNGYRKSLDFEVAFCQKRWYPFIWFPLLLTCYIQMVEPTCSLDLLNLAVFYYVNNSIYLIDIL